jgi:ABC-type cobalamin/Fe3+-siderophores transport system ATPase subunit
MENGASKIQAEPKELCEKEIIKEIFNVRLKRIGDTDKYYYGT